MHLLFALSYFWLVVAWSLAGLCLIWKKQKIKEKNLVDWLRHLVLEDGQRTDRGFRFRRGDEVKR